MRWFSGIRSELKLGCGPDEEKVVKFWKNFVTRTPWVKSRKKTPSESKMVQIQILV
jgi:hypothetical protein